MAGGKHYIHWKPVWGKIAKKNNCSFSWSLMLQLSLSFTFLNI
jgi:hypothetical protein